MFLFLCFFTIAGVFFLSLFSSFQSPKRLVYEKASLFLPKLKISLSLSPYLSISVGAGYDKREYANRKQ
jgi:hypothetical protein